MDTKTRTTKQGIRDLNFYGSRKKAPEAGAAGPLSVAESGLPAPVDAAVEPPVATPVPAAVVATAAI